jgi:phytoene dehydrogenase-like protein
MTSAVVVGAGPNGLAAAVTLAQHGIDVTVLEAGDTVGGGTRTSEPLIPGLLHDDCAAVHPIALASPFLRSLDLAAHGLQWAWPTVDLAHPLDDGSAGVLVRSIEQTAQLLGRDGKRWRRLIGPIASGFDDLVEDVLRPAAHLPRHPVPLARFGMRAAWPATVSASLFRTERARALFAGNAAHGWYPLSRVSTSAMGVMFAAIAHRHGWPVAVGGSSKITDALVDILKGYGAVVETSAPVRALGDIADTDIVMLDLSPRGVIDLAGDDLPPRISRAYRRYRPAPAAFKVDLAVEGGVPWTNEHARSAGTLHVCGSAAEVVTAERQIAAGQMPSRPFVLVAQQYLADPTRSVGSIHPVYAYAHVPHGYTGDATDAILAQLERFAPGTRERITGVYTRSPAQLYQDNPNYAGGDIIGGANNPRQLLMRPRIAPDPYVTGIPGVFICSASTPPGAGVHGMCGHNAAQSAIRQLKGGLI